MNNSRTILALTAAAGIALLATQSASADDAAPGGLAECAAIADDTQRLACFDALASRQPAQPAPAPAPPPEPAGPAPAPAAGPVPITDEIGRERVDGAREEEKPEYSATVTRCEESRQSGQTYFYFENGQVWRQSNYRRLRFRECRFEITLSEDTFGYSMYIPSEDRRIRVTRIR